MTLKQAKKAKENNLYVYHIEEPSLGGYITCFDDDETGFYYKSVRGYTPNFAPLEKMQIEKSK